MEADASIVELSARQTSSPLITLFPWHCAVLMRWQTGQRAVGPAMRVRVPNLLRSFLDPWICQLKTCPYMAIRSSTIRGSRFSFVSSAGGSLTACGVANLGSLGNVARRNLRRRTGTNYGRRQRGSISRPSIRTFPGQVRAAIPEIRTIAKSDREFLLLVELAKSAVTRSLIGSVLTKGVDVEDRIRSMQERDSRPSMRKRLGHALKRFEHAIREADLK